MKVCVTGGTGMVGRCIKHLVEEIYTEHHFTFLGSKDLDLRDKVAVLKYFKENRFTHIIHLAAKVGGLYKNMNDNIAMFTDNILINQNILEACNSNNITRGVFCLSSCIYPSNPSKFPMDETMIHESPPHYSNEGYAYSKRMLEILTKHYNELYKRQYICVIPVNLYGPHDNFDLKDGHFIPMIMNRFYKEKLRRENFLKSNNTGMSASEKFYNFGKTKKENPYVAYGSGEPLRQFLYAPDFAEIICQILLGRKYANIEPVICCNDDEYKIKDVVNKIGLTLGIKDHEIEWDKSKSDGCMKKTVTNEKFKKIYRKFEFTSLDEGLEKTYDWFVKNYKNIRE